MKTVQKARLDPQYFSLMKEMLSIRVLTMWVQSLAKIHTKMFLHLVQICAKHSNIGNKLLWAYEEKNIKAEWEMNSIKCNQTKKSLEKHTGVGKTNHKMQAVSAYDGKLLAPA